jgi:hypothetical protein
LFAEMQKFANLMAKLRQSGILGQIYFHVFIIS